MIVEVELEIALSAFLRDEFLEQKRLRGDGVHGVALEEGFQFVAEGEKARRLDADDGYAALDMWTKGGDNAGEFFARGFDQAGAEKCAAAAERTAAVGFDDVAAGGFENGAGGAGVFRFEVAAEAVNEEDDFFPTQNFPTLFRQPRARQGWSNRGSVIPAVRPVLLSQLREREKPLLGQRRGRRRGVRRVEPRPEITVHKQIHTQQRRQVRKRPTDVRLELQVLEHQ